MHDPQPQLYKIRIRGHLGTSTLRAFPEMQGETRAGDPVLTGQLHDQAALFGVIGQIERLGLELLEISGPPRR